MKNILDKSRAKGKFGYYLSNGVGDAQRDYIKYKYTDSTTYRPVLLGNSTVTDKIKATGLDGLDAQYAVITALLRDHPEGIWLRAEYGTHAIVITDYTEENGRIQLYAIDPVNGRDNGYGREPIERLYFYENNYKSGMIGDSYNGKYRINIAYLEQVGGSSTAPSQAPAQSTEGRPPTLTISGQNYPENMKQGSNFGVRGTVRTDYGVITTVYGEITDSNGNVVQYGRHQPNKSSDNLRYSINNDLIFDRLSAGSYIYRIQATAKNGSKETTQTLIECAFQVQGNSQASSAPAPEPTPTQGASDTQQPSVWISGENTPDNLQQGSNFGIRGTVYTDCGVLTVVYGEITDSNGNVIQCGRHQPNQASDNLRYSINNDLIFDRLSAGSYVYRVQATAKNGSKETSKTLIECAFQVQGNSQVSPAPTPAPTLAPAPTPVRTPVLSISGQNLPQDQRLGANFGIRGTVSTDCGTITELYGAVHAAVGTILTAAVWICVQP